MQICSKILRMIVTKSISSTSNPLVKELVAYQKSSERKKKGKFLVEGIREMYLALESGLEPEMVFVHQHFNENAVDNEYFEVLHKLFDKGVISLRGDVFARVFYRENGGDIGALFSAPKNAEQKFSKPNNMVFILDGIEKPGNVGAILRTADAANVFGVIQTNAITDLFNPNIVRSSLGAIFTLPYTEMTQEKAYEWLKKNDYTIVSTYLFAKESLYEANFPAKTAFILGSEAEGISSFWRTNSDKQIIIPMQGKVNSLNVSVSAAIVAYEHFRQND